MRRLGKRRMSLASTIVLQFFDKNDKPLLKGTSSVKSHNDWLELSSWSAGGERSYERSGGSGSLRGGGGDKSISFTFLPVNDTADVLNALVARGTTIEKAVLKCFKQSGSEYVWYLQMEFKKAIVASLQIPGDENSTASGSLTYDTQVVVYQTPTHTNVELDGSGPDDWSYVPDDPE
jgi:type VI protein secretion system component Hcp